MSTPTSDISAHTMVKKTLRPMDALVAMVVLACLYFSHTFSYMLFHGLAEVFSVTVAFGIFTIAWNGRRYLPNDYLKVIGVGYLFCGFVDLLHTFSYEGMNVFVGYEPQLTMQLWNVARYVQAATLLGAAFFIQRRIGDRTLWAICVATTSALLAVVFSGYFPDCFIVGKGITPFKIVSEYVVSGTFFVALILFYRQRSRFDPRVFWLIALSLVLTIASELMFTLLTTMQDRMHMIGHLLKFAEFYFMYLAIIVIGLNTPFDLIFRDLKLSEQALLRYQDSLEETVRERTAELRTSEQEFRSLAENLPDNVVRYDREGRTVYVNAALEETLGAEAARMLGTRVRELYPDGSYEAYAQAVDATLASGKGGEIEIAIPIPGKEPVIHQIHIAAERDERGEVIGVLAIGRDITQRQRTENALRQITLFQRTILANAAYGIISTTPDGMVTSFNPAAERLLGYTADEMVGKQTPACWHDPEEVARYARQLSEEQGETILPGFEVFAARARRNLPEENEWTFICKDGRRIPVSLSVTALRDEAGKITGFVGMGYDLTERKRAEDEIYQLNYELEQRVADRTAQLEAANQELEAFSYSVSHDLRTPLRAIDGFSNILLEDYASKLDDEGKRLLGVVRDNTTRMGQLIDDILKFSRTGRTELASAEVDMEKIVRDVLNELKPSVMGSKLQVEIEHLPAIKGDGAMLHQVFVNLLTNAIKFSRTRDAPRIEVGAEIRERETTYFVKDNGVGFDMQYADKLFGVFQRLHSVNEFEGTGIGLAIVKRIIIRHGGRVWAEGKVNEGATFYFALPIR